MWPLEPLDDNGKPLLLARFRIVMLHEMPYASLIAGSGHCHQPHGLQRQVWAHVDQLDEKAPGGYDVEHLKDSIQDRDPCLNHCLRNPIVAFIFQ